MPRRRRSGSSSLSNVKGGGKRRQEHPADERPRKIRGEKKKEKEKEKKTPPRVPAPSQADQRIAVYVVFSKLGAPSPDKWEGVASKGGTLALITKATGVSRKVALPVLRQLYGRPMVPATFRKSNRPGLTPKIVPGTSLCDKLIGGLTSGWGQRWTSVMADVDHSTVGRTAKRLKILCRKRGKKKTGKRDPTSAWAIARAAICLQFKRQLILGIA